MQNFHQPTQEHESLYAYRYSRGEQLLILETKYKIMASGLKLTFTFGFMEITHEMLRLDKRCLVQLKIIDILTSYTWIIFFDGIEQGYEIWEFVKINANHSV
jgi:hypothetical protein